MIKRIVIRILTFEIFSLFFNPEINMIKLNPQIEIPRKIESGVNMPKPFNGVMIEMKTIVIIKIAIAAIIRAILFCFIYYASRVSIYFKPIVTEF